MVSAMQSLVVGTAGHIDHGKSTLVRALTGIDPDRLQEEKARGITIDLGFAHAEVGRRPVLVRRRARPRTLREEHARGRDRDRRGRAGRGGRRVGDAADARALRHLPAAGRAPRRRRADQGGPRRSRTRSNWRRSRCATSCAGRSSRTRPSCRSRRRPGSGLDEVRAALADVGARVPVRRARASRACPSTACSR